MVGQVKELWEGQTSTENIIFVKVQHCQLSDVVDPYYGMRRLMTLDDTSWLTEKVSSVGFFSGNSKTRHLDCSKDLKCLLNIQHNCHEGQCKVTNSGEHRVERTLTTIKLPKLKHNNLNSYLINAAATYSAEAHRVTSGHQRRPVQPHEWSASITRGLAEWVRLKPPRTQDATL